MISCTTTYSCDYCKEEFEKDEKWYRINDYQHFKYPIVFEGPLTEHKRGPICKHNKPMHNECRRKCRTSKKYNQFGYTSKQPYHVVDGPLDSWAVPIGQIRGLSVLPKRRFKTFDIHEDCLKTFIASKLDVLDNIDYNKIAICNLAYVIDGRLVNIVTFTIFPVKNSDAIMVRLDKFDERFHDKRHKKYCYPDDYANDKFKYECHDHEIFNMRRECPSIVRGGHPWYGKVPSVHLDYIDILNRDDNAELINDKDAPALYTFENSEIMLSSIVDIIIDEYYHIAEYEKDETEEPVDPPTDPDTPTEPDTPIDPDEPIVDPEDPIVDPDEPTDPDTPTEPDEPIVDPDTPIDPEQPDEPIINPEEPSEEDNNGGDTDGSETESEPTEEPNTEDTIPTEEMVEDAFNNDEFFNDKE